MPQLAVRLLPKRWMIRAAVGLIVFFLALTMIVLLMTLARLQGGCGGGAEGGSYSSAEVPKGFPKEALPYVPLYKEAERTYKVNWLILAAIHKHETNFGTLKAPGVTSGRNAHGCCAGPMQFNLNDTWEGHKNAYKRGERPSNYPQKRGDHPSVYDPFDSIMAAADKLHKQGAGMGLNDAGMNKAFAGYGAGGPSDAARRADIARWSGAPTTTVAGGSFEGGGDCGGNEQGTGTGTGEMMKPCQGPLTSGFGPRSSPGGIGSTNHMGQDLGCPNGAPIKAADSGRVVLAGSNAGYGNYTCISHGSLTTCYGHQSKISVRQGQSVEKGDVIGRVGSTGHSTGPHLHFEVRKGGPRGQAVDPKPYLS